MSVPKFKHQKLGASGLSISPVIIGCMTFGSKEYSDWVIDDEDKVMLILKKCYDNGLRTFDTADVYSNGQSEILLGKFLKKYNIPRERVVILTKVFFPVDTTDPDFSIGKYSQNKYPEVDYVNAQGLSRKHIFEAVKNSVERLGTYIDVLQIHRLDNATPKEEIMKALNDVVELGHTRYLGASSMKATEFAQLQFIADKHGWAKFISMQNYYNLLYREEEREMIPFCNDNIFGKVGLIPYSPIARGLLARPSKSTATERFKSDARINQLGLDKLSDSEEIIISRVEQLSKKLGVSMAAIATKWVLSKGAFPIVGVNSEERVDNILSAFSFELKEDDLAYLEEPYVPRPLQF